MGGYTNYSLVANPLTKGYLKGGSLVEATSYYTFELLCSLEMQKIARVRPELIL